MVNLCMAWPDICEADRFKFQGFSKVPAMFKVKFSPRAYREQQIDCGCDRMSVLQENIEVNTLKMPLKPPSPASSLRKPDQHFHYVNSKILFLPSV